MRQVIPLLVLAVIVPYLLLQVRKPTRIVGRFYLWIMNVSHSKLTDWGLNHIEIGERSVILDVGCGGGRTIQKLSEIARSETVCGIDYSMESVTTSRSRNARLIEAKRVEIKHAPVSNIPYPENAFDLAIAVETQYYWPDPVNDMREILRVLKPDGTLIVIAESYNKGRYSVMHRPFMRLLRTTHLTASEHGELFTRAGYRNVEVFEEQNKGWICVTGSK